MNNINNEMATSPNLSYTSRDYNNIYNELINSIPLLTKEWDAKDENDPGVAIVKLLSMLGDMLSFIQDKNALEVYPRTVLQRANAQQIFRLIGYKMHWYRSAKVNIQIINNNSFPIYISRFAIFNTNNSDISYTTLNPIEVAPGEGDASFSTELIQGTPVTPKLIGNIKPDNYNAEWHSMYDYNCLASTITNNRIYLKYNNIDETSIILIDNDETPFSLNEWKLVENINTTDGMNKVFEFGVDENGNTFIELPGYWNKKYVITKFKIFFVISNGIDGEIEENVIKSVHPNKCYTTQENININEALSLIEIFNEASTYGYSPETCTEARKNAENYINTIDTLITLTDFEKAIKRIDSVANCVATDIQIDPFKEDMTNNQINLWIIRKNDYNNLGEEYIYRNFSENNISDELFKENIISELSNYKLMPYNINVNLEDQIDWINWSVKGQIYLRQPISSDVNKDLMVSINTNLKKRFNIETLDFNEPINYMDVIECIMKTDKNIWHVDLDDSNIKYRKVKRSKKGTPTGNIILTKYKIFNVDENGNKTNDTGYYITSFGCTSIELERLKEYDLYNKVTDSESPYYLPGTSLPGLNYNTNVFTENSVTPGGNGSGKNIGNIIRRDDGKIVTNIFESDKLGPREYEVYNGFIIDWTGFEPIETGYYIYYDVIDNKFYIKNKKSKITENDDQNITIDDDKIKFELEEQRIWYLPDGTKTNKYLSEAYHRISGLYSLVNEVNDNLNNIVNNAINILESGNNLTKNDINEYYSESDIENLTNEQIVKKFINEVMLGKNYIRLCLDIIDDQDTVHSTIDQITGEIFIKRGKYWYTTFRSYDKNTGEILNNKGDVIIGENLTYQYESCSREDLTGEYIQYFDPTLNVDESNKYKSEYDFYLGQNESGDQLLDSIGNVINAYPIKPYNIFIYINGDEYIISDNGSGKLVGSNNVLNGYGSINYNTGKISFKLNIIPTSIKILYRINKLTHAIYETFDTNTFFVKPEFLRNINRL